MLKKMTALSALALVLSVFLAGCGPTAKPLSQLPKQKGSFSLNLTTNVLQDWSGSLVPHEVDMNVPLAKKAITTMTAMGYKYQPDGGTYDITIQLICYDALMVKTVHEQDEVLDAMDPLGDADFDYAVNQVALSETWMRMGPGVKDHCTGKAFMKVVVAPGGKGNIYQGALFSPQDNYVQGCPFSACSPDMDRHLPKLMHKVFDR